MEPPTNTMDKLILTQAILKFEKAKFKLICAKNAKYSVSLVSSVFAFFVRIIPVLSVFAFFVRINPALTEAKLKVDEAEAELGVDEAEAELKEATDKVELNRKKKAQKYKEEAEEKLHQEKAQKDKEEAEDKLHQEKAQKEKRDKWEREKNKEQAYRNMTSVELFYSH